MSDKNEYARRALLAFDVFLASRRDGAEGWQGDRRSAVRATEVLKPFLEKAERDIIDAFGERPFPAKFFIDLLNDFVNEEWHRRMVAQADMGPIVDTIYTIIPFLDIVASLLPQYVAPDGEDGNAV